MKQTLKYLFVSCLLVAAGHRVCAAEGAHFFLSPARSTYLLGEPFTVSIRLDTGGASINAAEATLAFEPDELEVISISKANSVFTLWPLEPEFSNNSGSLTFSGGLPSPGFNGSSGLIFSMTLRAKTTGTFAIRYISGVALVNDGNGTNVLSSSQSAAITIPTPAKKTLPPAPSPKSVPPLPPVISSATHPVSPEPDTSHWSSNRNPEFEWKSDPDVIGFSYEFDQSPTTVPDTVSEGTQTVKAYTDAADGIWHFHVRASNTVGWSDASHYTVHIDATAPEAFSIEVVGGRDVTDPTPSIRFITKDLLSGMDHYTVQVGHGAQKNYKAPELPESVELDSLEPGTYAVQVTASDRADNPQSAFAEFAVHDLAAPTITAYAKTIGGDEVIFLEGKTLPNSIVVITIEKADGSDRTTREVTADAEGNWVYLGLNYRASGKWRITVQAKNAEGAVSLAKAEVAVEVLSTAIRIGDYSVTYASAYGAGGAVLLGVVLAIFFVFLRYRKKIGTFSRNIEKEVKEAERAIAVGFRTLRQDVIEELRTIDSLQKIRPLTIPEDARREKLIKDLAFIEVHVTKEVRDIETVLEGHEPPQEMLPPPPAPPSMP